MQPRRGSKFLANVLLYVFFIAKVITIVVTVSIIVVIVATSVTLDFRMNGRLISGSGHLELSGLDQGDFCFCCCYRFLVGFFFEVEIPP